MTAGDVEAFGADHVVLATGSRWRRDGVGVLGVEGFEVNALTPDDVFAGAAVVGPVVIYDDEHYFMGGALAERLRREGHEVVLVTPQSVASSWTAMTDEQGFVQGRLLELGVRRVLSLFVAGRGAGVVRVGWAYTGRETEVACGTLVLVTGRLPDDALFQELGGHELGGKAVRVGDCLAPSSIADAVYSGHAFARGLGEVEAVLRRERAPCG